MCSDVASDDGGVGSPDVEWRAWRRIHAAAAAAGGVDDQCAQLTHARSSQYSAGPVWTEE